MEQETREENKLKSFIDKLKKNPWKVTSVVFGLACLVLLVLVLKPQPTGSIIPGDIAGEKLVKYLNSRVGGGVEYVSYKDWGSLYQITVLFEDDIRVYITKDGLYFIEAISPIGLIDPITGKAIPESSQQQ